MEKCSSRTAFWFMPIQFSFCLSPAFPDIDFFSDLSLSFVFPTLIIYFRFDAFVYALDYNVQQIRACYKKPTQTTHITTVFAAKPTRERRS